MQALRRKKALTRGERPNLQGTAVGSVETQEQRREYPLIGFQRVADSAFISTGNSEAAIQELVRAYVRKSSSSPELEDDLAVQLAYLRSPSTGWEGLSEQTNYVEVNGKSLQVWKLTPEDAPGITWRQKHGREARVLFVWLEDSEIGIVDIVHSGDRRFKQNQVKRKEPNTSPDGK